MAGAARHAQGEAESVSQTGPACSRLCSQGRETAAPSSCCDPGDSLAVILLSLLTVLPPPASDLQNQPPAPPAAADDHLSPRGSEDFHGLRELTRLQPECVQ